MEAAHLIGSPRETVRVIGYFPTDARILYVSDQGGDELDHVHVREVDGTSRDLTPGERLRARFSGWAADGSHFYVSTNERDPRFFDLYEYDAATYARRRIFENNAGHQVRAVSPDGRLVGLSRIHDNARHAGYEVLNEYRQPRSAAGHPTPFALQVLDSQQVFAGQGVLPVEAVRLRDANATPAEIRSRLEFLAGRSYSYMVPRDLGYLRARTRHRGDRSVSLLASVLGTAFDIRPVLHCHQGETGPVDSVRGFEPAARRLFDFACERVREGLLTPTLCLSYGGELDAMRALPHYDRLIATCREHGIEVFETVMSLTGLVNVGPGALTIGIAAPPHAFV